MKIKEPIINNIKFGDGVNNARMVIPPPTNINIASTLPIFTEAANS